jgi:ornithine carbamoyltransferase
MKKDLLTLKDWSKEDVIQIIEEAILVKEDPEKYYRVLRGKSMAMLFEKPSTRTRVSFEVGMSQLGGHAIYLDWKTTQLGKADLKDEIKSISRYADIIMARVYKHTEIEIMAKSSDKPVINALSDTYHPCQALADLLTIKEKFGNFSKVKLAYVGDGNNVCNSLIVGCKKVGIKISVACPKGYEPKEKPDLLTQNAALACTDADVVYTDTWVSMGKEEEKKKRLNVFPPYQVNKKLIGEAYFMHCLPVYRGYEVTNEVMDSKRSIVFEQAENRLHAQKTLMLKLMGKI